jgi:hypothetical protein
MTGRPPFQFSKDPANGVANQDDGESARPARPHHVREPVDRREHSSKGTQDGGGLRPMVASFHSLSPQEAPFGDRAASEARACNARLPRNGADCKGNMNKGVASGARPSIFGSQMAWPRGARGVRCSCSHGTASATSASALPRRRCWRWSRLWSSRERRKCTE